MEKRLGAPGLPALRGPAGECALLDGLIRDVRDGKSRPLVLREAMCRQAPAGLLGIHVNLAATVRPEIAKALAGAGPVPADMSDQEREVFDALGAYAKSGYSGYFVAMTARPQAVGYGLTDSPAGLAAFILWHPGFANWNYGEDPQRSPTKDEVLDDFSLYWLTNTATSSGRLYWENHGASPTQAAAMKTSEISVPVGVTVFPEDVYRPPETWARRALRTSFTSTKWTAAATSPPGSSLSCSPASSGTLTDRCAR